MSTFSLPAWLRPVRGAVPVSSIPAEQLPALNAAIAQGRVAVQTIRYRGRVGYFVFPVAKPPSTAETQ